MSKKTIAIMVITVIALIGLIYLNVDRIEKVLTNDVLEYKSTAFYSWR